MRRVPLFVAGAAAVVAVALTGYVGAFGVDAPGPDTEVAETEVDAKAAELEEANPGEYREYESSLDRYRSDIFGADYEEEVEYEEAVAVCMKERGFEYTPYVDPSNHPESINFESEEWVAQYGYGILTRGEPVGYIDPNDQYEEGLSDAEKAAYDDALYKDDRLRDDDPSKVGCAWLPHTDPFASEEARALQKDLNALYDGYHVDPAFIEADKEWASCMAAAGYVEPDQSSQDAVDFPRGKFNNRRFDFIYGSSFDWNGAEGDEWRKLEIETALADLKCKTEVGYSEKVLKVQFEREEQFVKDHQALLDLLRERDAG